jgi:hypothetical protein
VGRRCEPDVFLTRIKDTGRSRADAKHIDKGGETGHTSFSKAGVRATTAQQGEEQVVTDSQQEPEDGLLGRVQSLVRAFGILDELAKSDHMTLSDLSRAVGLPRSTTHRLLTTMEALRYVAFDRRKNGWSVGVQAFTVGTAMFTQCCTSDISDRMML